MKILVFYQYFGTPNGGWSTRYYEFTRRWVQEGHEVKVVTSPYYKSDIKADGFISRQWVEGVELIVIDSPDSNKAPFLKRAWNALRFAIVSIYFALTESHDIVLSSSGPITTALPGLISKWFRKKPFVFEVRDLWPRGGIEMGKLANPAIRTPALAFERLIYRHADLIVACSKGMESGVIEIDSKANTLVIPNSSDIDLFGVQSELPTFPDGFNPKLAVFLYAGSLGEMDDCSQIIAGMNLLQDDVHVSMVFIGDGSERSLLEEKAKLLPSNVSCYFLGLIPKTEVVKWFGIARASFVTFQDLPVLHTNSPNKMFDSFAAGVPIIQSTKGWIKELVELENIGINVDPASAQSFANSIQLLAADQVLARSMGDSSKRLAETDFNRNLLSQLYLKNLKEINN
ncbi:MAG: glycosyltransferase involved in cell wall biosynthesis [Planctomycetota bacterium]